MWDDEVANTLLNIVTELWVTIREFAHVMNIIITFCHFDVAVHTCFLFGKGFASLISFSKEILLHFCPQQFPRLICTSAQTELATRKV